MVTFYRDIEALIRAPKSIRVQFFERVIFPMYGPGGNSVGNLINLLDYPYSSVRGELEELTREFVSEFRLT